MDFKDYVGFYPMSTKKKEDRLDPSDNYKVVPGSEESRKLQQTSGSFYGNIPKHWILEQAKAVGMSVADFVLNYEFYVAEVYPEGGNPILDGKLVFGFRRIPKK